MEHRWGERVRVDLPVRVTAHPFAVKTGRLLDLSVSGALLKVDFPIRPLLRIEVILDRTQPSKCDAPLLCAYVTRRYKDGVGIEWCNFAPPDVSRLLHTLALRPNVRLRRPELHSAVAVTRLSSPLLKHGT